MPAFSTGHVTPIQPVSQSGPWSMSISGPSVVTQAAGDVWGVSLGYGAAVAVSNFPATQVVSGSVSIGNLPAVQSVSFSGQSVAATQSGPWSVSLSGTSAIAGSVSVTNLPTTQAVTQSGAWSVSLSGSTAIQGGNSTAVYVREPSIRSVGALGAAGSAGVIVTATIAGGMTFTFADGSTMPVYAPLGTTIFRMVPTSVTAGVVGTLLAATINSVKSFSES